VFDLSRYYAVRNETFGGFAAVGEGWNVAVERLTYYVRQFKVIFSPETGAYKEVGGFYAILKQYPDEWDWRSFWEFTAFLSIMLGFLNVLPIPALDGGHAVFVIIEMITGKAPSTRILEVAQTIGFVLLLGLLICARGTQPKATSSTIITRNPPMKPKAAVSVCLSRWVSGTTSSITT
jgi:regulator of sigma E protease